MPHLTSTQTSCRYNALTELSAARAIPTRLALVTVHRPADTLATLGWNGTNGRTDNPADLTTVLRSWEDRLGAYLIAIGDDTLEVIVERPAATDTDRLAWIAERTAFNPDTTLVDDSITLGLLAELPDEPRAVFWWD